MSSTTHIFCSVLLSLRRLVPSLEELESSHSSKSDSCPSDAEDEDNRSITPQNQSALLQTTNPRLDGTLSLNSNSEDDEIGDGLRTVHHQSVVPTDHLLGQTGTLQSTQEANIDEVALHGAVKAGGSVALTGTVERRRRKLPEIPKNKKRESFLLGGKKIDSV